MSEPIKAGLMPPFETSKCVQCGADFTRETTTLSRKYNLSCGPCSDKEEAARAERERLHTIELLKQGRIDNWRKRCPAIFQETTPEKLPDQRAFQESMRWQYGTKGLVLHGPSGSGKSRIAWLILKREYDTERKFRVLDSMAGLQYASKYSDSAVAVEEWMDDLIATDLLFMDDIFKNKLTDSFEGVIFTLIDQRIQQMRPIILTSNDTGDSLASRMTQDRAEPLIRRIREHSLSIAFK